MVKLMRDLASKIFRQILMLRSRIKLSIGFEPLSHSWSDRGKPIHREYLEQFLADCSVDIKGVCLEFQEDSYTSQFGGEKVLKVDILHKEEGNPKATIVADLTAENTIPSDIYDCIICTYTLHLVYKFQRMVSELHRILRPGGVLLVAVPCISTCYSKYHEFWRFTPEGLTLLLAECFVADNIMVKFYGNSLTAAGELRGLRLHEFSNKEAQRHDSRYPLVVCARAQKNT